MVFGYALAVPNRFVEHYVFKRRFGAELAAPWTWLADTYKLHAAAVVLTPFLAEPVSLVRGRAPYTLALVSTLTELLASILNAIVWEQQAGKKLGDFDALEEPLATDVRRLAVRCGRKPDHLVRVGRDENDTKLLPACASGWFAGQYIVFHRSTIRRFTRRQFVWIAAHELGHIVAEDRLRYEAADVLKSLAVNFGTPAVIRSRGYRLDTSAGTLRASFAMCVMQTASRLAYNAYRRRRERAADAFATGMTGDPLAGASVHRRFIAYDPAGSDEPRWYNALFGVHPPSRERFRAAYTAYRAGRTYLGEFI